jgi:hypothetical protein
MPQADLLLRDDRRREREDRFPLLVGDGDGRVELLEDLLVGLEAEGAEEDRAGKLPLMIRTRRSPSCRSR